MRKYIKTETTKSGIEIAMYECTNIKGQTWFEYEVLTVTI